MGRWPLAPIELMYVAEFGLSGACEMSWLSELSAGYIGQPASWSARAACARGPAPPAACVTPKASAQTNSAQTSASAARVGLDPSSERLTGTTLCDRRAETRRSPARIRPRAPCGAKARSALQRDARALGPAATRRKADARPHLDLLVGFDELAPCRVQLDLDLARRARLQREARRAVADELRFLRLLLARHAGTAGRLDVLQVEHARAVDHEALERERRRAVLDRDRQLGESDRRKCRRRGNRARTRCGASGGGSRAATTAAAGFEVSAQEHLAGPFTHEIGRREQRIGARCRA